MFRVTQLRKPDSYLIEGNGTGLELKSSIPRAAAFVRLVIYGNPGVFDERLSSALRDVSRLSVFCSDKIDLSSLGNMVRLKSLFLSGHYVNQFSFGEFGSIVSLGFYKDEGIINVENVTTIRNLAVYEVNGDIDDYIYGAQFSLDSLDVSSCDLKSPTSRSSIDSLKALRVRNSIVSRNFIDRISNDNLDTVYLQGVDIRGAISILSHAKNLRILVLDDCGRIDDLRFLGGTRIEYLLIQGKTTVDDLRAVLELENIREFSYGRSGSRIGYGADIARSIRSKNIVPAPSISDVWSLEIFS